jgi:ribonuclease T1
MVLRRRRRGGLLAIFGAVVAIFVSLWAARENKRAESRPAETRAERTVPPPVEPPPVAATPSQGHHLPDLVPDDAERAEIVKTLRLIKIGGPFPHRQDGVVFANREHRLPQKPRGYYHEYTVNTPGERTRGARRIVRGGSGEIYYTNDHYRTFVRLDNV